MFKIFGMNLSRAQNIDQEEIVFFQANNSTISNLMKVKNMILMIFNFLKSMCYYYYKLLYVEYIVYFSY
jgi:hypothetical protein